MLLASGKLDAQGRTLAKLVYWLPLIQIAFGTYHVPGAALIPPAFAAYLLLRLIGAGDRDRLWTLPATARGAVRIS